MENFYKFLRYIYAGVMIALMLSSVSCDSSVEEPEIPEVKEVDRTIIVYVVATNNLGYSGYDQQDIEEMKLAAKAGHFGNGRLLMYHAAYNRRPILKEITAKGIDTLKVYGSDTLSVSQLRMRQVMEDVKALSPAASYGMVCWSHASGWLEDGVQESRANKLYSFGSDNGNRMNITSMRDVLIDQGLDFIYFDCCFMGSVESIYELRNVTPVIISSPTEDPAEGMPYHSTLKHLFSAKAKEDYDAAARSTYEYYDSVYVRGNCPVSMVVSYTESFDKLAKTTRAIYERAEKPWPQDYEPQILSLSPYYYFDFADYVETLCDDEDLLAQWRAVYDQCLSYKACTQWIWSDTEVTRFGGLSTYIFASPNDKYFNNKNYASTSWYNDVASALVK